MSDSEKKEKTKLPQTEEEVAKELPMKDITDSQESDVLCGRGGAALRHPGNQTYRRLVNLNKQLYITCFKSEKLKISRSIVAAIREQYGRFLEKDSEAGTWYDIGDKKAIEKTSQALREGQPKLRQKMIDDGQIPPDSEVSIEQQFSNGIYNPRGAPDNGGGGRYTDAAMLQRAQHLSNNISVMPPPRARVLGNEMSASMTPDMMMQRLSLSGIPQNQIPSWNPNVSSGSMGSGSMGGPPSFRGGPSSMNGPPSFRGTPGALSMPNWTPSMHPYMSMMSDARSMKYGSGMGGAPDGFQLEFDMWSDQLHQQQLANSNGNAAAAPPPPPDMSPMMMGSPSLRSSHDRRRYFAKMKAHRSGRMGDSSHHSRGDGMPEIHMVDSNYSLLSNMSGHGKDPLSGFSNHNMKDSEHSVGLGSRRSLMSGLSKISDHSETAQSVFSDLSKKFANNLSMRSMAMSEMSGIDDIDESEVDEFGGDDFQDTFKFDSLIK